MTFDNLSRKRQLLDITFVAGALAAAALLAALATRPAPPPPPPEPFYPPKCGVERPLPQESPCILTQPPRPGKDPFARELPQRPMGGKVRQLPTHINPGGRIPRALDR